MLLLILLNLINLNISMYIAILFFIFCLIYVNYTNFFSFKVNLFKTNKNVKLNKVNKFYIYLWKPLFKKNSYWNYFIDYFVWRF